ncbi:MAG: hypothetical protein HYR66_18380 [Sphingobacteriales bacterium]|nr:hypothetical protein [Sphingobacteriales bacterium]
MYQFQNLSDVLSDFTPRNKGNKPQKNPGVFAPCIPLREKFKLIHYRSTELLNDESIVTQQAMLLALKPV